MYVQYYYLNYDFSPIFGEYNLSINICMAVTRILLFFFTFFVINYASEFAYLLSITKLFELTVTVWN